MPAIKYITLALIVIFLHQSVAALFPFDLFRKITADSIGTSFAYAEEESSLQTVPSPQQESPQMPGSNQETSEQQPAQKPADEAMPSQETAPKPEIYGPERGYADMVQAEISQRVLGSAEWLDSFFVDRREIREANRSYLRIRYDIFMEDSTKQKIEMPSFSLQLRLPRLERLAKNVNLVIESAPEAEPAGVPVQESDIGAQVLPAESRTRSVALHFLLRETAEQSFIVRTGARLNLDHALFISPRYRLSIPLDSWNFRFTQDVIYRPGTPRLSKSEWETETLFDLERKLPYNDLFFRSYLDWVWLKNTDEYIYNLGCSLLQPLDSKRALSYTWNNRVINKPDLDLDEILFSIQYRQNFWRKWLFYEVVPQYRFPQDRDFTGTAGILFRLEMYFGYIRKK